MLFIEWWTKLTCLSKAQQTENICSLPDIKRACSCNEPGGLFYFECACVICLLFHALQRLHVLFISSEVCYAKLIAKLSSLFDFTAFDSKKTTMVSWKPQFLIYRHGHADTKSAKPALLFLVVEYPICESFLQSSN